MSNMKQHFIALRSLGLLFLAAVASAVAQETGLSPEPIEVAQPQSVELPAMVVTGTRTERSILEVPVRTEIVDMAEIDLTRSVKLADIIEYQPGLRVENNCQNCGTSEIRMLGLQQRYINILTDGMQTFSGLAGVYGIEQIPTMTIDRIEIVKGGGSSLYGPNAVAGIINLIPRNPTHRHASVDFQYNWMDGDKSGNQPNTDASAYYEYASEDQKFGFYTYGLQSFMDGLDVTNDRFTEVSLRDLYGGGARFVYRPTDTREFTLDYLFTTEERRGGEGGSGLDVSPNLSFLAEELLSDRHVGVLTMTDTLSEKFDYRLGASMAHTDRGSYYGGIAALGYAPPGSAFHNPAIPGRLSTLFPQYAPAFADPGGIFYNPAWTPQLGFGETENLISNFDLAANSYLGLDHTLTYGFQAQLEQIDDFTTLGRAVDDQYNNYGLFLQHDWFLSDQWELLYGIRGDKHSKVDQPIFSPRGTLKYSPSGKLDFRLAASTGFRAPQLFDEDLHISNVGGEFSVIELADDLEEESSYSFTLGSNYRINTRWTLDANLFYTGIDDLFFTDLTTDDPTTPGVIEATKRNSGNADVFGGELNIRLAHDDFSIDFGYVEQRSHYGDPQVLLGTAGDPVDNEITVDRFERTPNSYGVITLGYNNGTWAGFISNKFTGGMDIPHVVSDPLTGDLIGNELTRSNPFYVIDVGLSYKIPLQFHDHSSIKLFAGVKNLFNGFQDDLDNGPFRDAAYVYGPRFPRTIYGGMNIEF